LPFLNTVIQHQLYLLVFHQTDWTVYEMACLFIQYPDLIYSIHSKHLVTLKSSCKI